MVTEYCKHLIVCLFVGLWASKIRALGWSRHSPGAQQTFNTGGGGKIKDGRQDGTKMVPQVKAGGFPPASLHMIRDLYHTGHILIEV